MKKKKKKPNRFSFLLIQVKIALTWFPAYLNLYLILLISIIMLSWSCIFKQIYILEAFTLLLEFTCDGTLLSQSIFFFNWFTNLLKAVT